ncbi:hypothetical protein BDZ97DRAFT_986270 [Flammula alnicola]|nr:hypothetical protein BDZ97DRAFT_986270 [Flammula alnicola]
MVPLFTLPRLLLLMSIVISSSSFGLVVPSARELPLRVTLTIFTTIFHSFLLISGLSHNSPGHGHQFYINPLETPFNIWLFLSPFFWLASFTHDVNALGKGKVGDVESCSMMFSCIESTINVHLAYLCIMEWRKQTEMPRRAPLGDKFSAEANFVTQILRSLALWRLELQKELLKGGLRDAKAVAQRI